MTKKVFLLIFILFGLNIKYGFSADPVFMSLKSSKVNLRGGPNKDFPLLCIYTLKNMPVKVVGEYDKWYKIVDKDGDGGWISENLLSKARTVVTTKDMQLLYVNYNKEAYPIYRIEKNVVAKLLKCKKDRCKVKIKKVKGWLDKDSIWGYEDK